MLHGCNGKMIENPDAEMYKAVLQGCEMWFSEEDTLPGVVPETGPAKNPPGSASFRRQTQINPAVIKQADRHTMTCIMRIIHRHGSFPLTKSCMHVVGHPHTPTHKTYHCLSSFPLITQ